jgi:hypothetical protein
VRNSHHMQNRCRAFVKTVLSDKDYCQ